MISPSSEQYEKIRLLDMLFNSMSVEQLKDIAESEKIVAVLKGQNDSSLLLSRIITENDLLSAELFTLKSEVHTLRNDLQTLIRLVLKPHEYNAPNDAATLKSRYYIY